jgi:hypothetical protein
MSDWVFNNFGTFVFLLIVVLCGGAIAAQYAVEEDNRRLSASCREKGGVPMITRGHTRSFVCLRPEKAIDVK